MIKRRLVTIGYGSAGRPLTLALKNAGWDIKGIVTATDEDLERVKTDNLLPLSLDNFPLDIDVLIFAVPDHKIHVLAEKIRNNLSEQYLSNSIVAMHIAGRFCQKPLTPLLDLGWSRLAWHPLQSFNPKSTPENLKDIFAGVTADNDADMMADLICSDLNIKRLNLDSTQRGSYHLAAVIASNFLPAIVQCAIEEHPFGKTEPRKALDSLLPLITGMLNNLNDSLPEEAMSGPVTRGDFNAVNKQYNSIQDENGKELYRVLTEYLIKMKLKSGMLSKDNARELLNALK